MRVLPLRGRGLPQRHRFRLQAQTPLIQGPHREESPSRRVSAHLHQSTPKSLPCLDACTSQDLKHSFETAPPNSPPPSVFKCGLLFSWLHQKAPRTFDQISHMAMCAEGQMRQLQWDHNSERWYGSIAFTYSPTSLYDSATFTGSRDHARSVRSTRRGCVDRRRRSRARRSTSHQQVWRAGLCAWTHI